MTRESNNKRGRRTDKDFMFLSFMSKLIPPFFHITIEINLSRNHACTNLFRYPPVLFSNSFIISDYFLLQPVLFWKMSFKNGKPNAFPRLSEYNSLQVIFQMPAVPVSPVQVPPR